MFKTSRGDEPAEFIDLLQFVHEATQIAEKNKGFVSQRGDHCYHVLFGEVEMEPYFDAIRSDLANGKAGGVLSAAMASGKIGAESSNRHLWETLVHSLKFSGIDFEHHYEILPSEVEHRPGTWDYNFDESIVLGHSPLLVPVMQHYGPFAPKLDVNGPSKKLATPQPLLAVGMIGDCVKGKFFEEIKRLAEDGDAVAVKQRDTLLHPERLQQKMLGLVKTLVETARQSKDRGLVVDAVLVGTGAFGGSAKVLAQPFVDSLNVGLPFDESKDEVNFFMFPPPKPEELTLEQLKYKATLNSKQGLGATSEKSNVVRVVVAGFDPISIAPHGVLNRVFSAEGQVSHATDLLERLTKVRGRFMRVQVPKGSAWESPAAFFANPQQHKYKDEEGYETVRFVPEETLTELGVTSDFENTELVAVERNPPRVWNGDSFNGWRVSRNGKLGKTWQDVLNPSTPKTLRAFEEDNIQSTLKILDTNKDGTIRKHDLEQVIKDVLCDWPEDDIRDLMTEVDKEHLTVDGKVNYNEFLMWLFNTSR